MKEDCKPPKCVAVARRNSCQCPNSWIEYLASTAAQRKRSGLSKLSIAQYSKQYQRSRRNGAYRSRKSDLSICNGNDTRELCSMYALRKSGKDKKGIDFDQDFLTLKSKLLRPTDGGVFAADYKKYALIVKWKFDVSTKEKRYDFLYQTKTHLRCW